ncbi:MAG: hypothetical protein KAI53_03030 [Candidatus Aenigmarchaeota archaeon]|nr:hypothetical protein [Candidatus Aenigmarchaeota archaeon]
MATKVKKKCVHRSKAAVKKGQGNKGQFLATGTTIKIILIIVALVITMSVMSANKGALAEISDWFMGILADLGLVHLSDTDRIALASMQAATCAVDVVAFYSNEPLPKDGDDIFAGFESCGADFIGAGSGFSTFENIAVGSGGPVVSTGEDSTGEDEEEKLPVLTGVQKWTNENGDGLPRTLIGNYECSGSSYKIELVDIISKSSGDGQALEITQDAVIIEDYFAVWAGSSETTEDIVITTTAAIFVSGLPSESKVSGEVSCKQ